MEVDASPAVIAAVVGATVAAGAASVDAGSIDVVAMAQRDELLALRAEITASCGGVFHNIVPDAAFLNATRGADAHHNNNTDQEMLNGVGSLSGGGFEGGGLEPEHDAPSEASSGEEEGNGGDSADDAPHVPSTDDSSVSDESVGAAIDEQALLGQGDDDEDETPAGPLRTEHEVPLSKLPVPSLPYLVAQGSHHLEPIGAVLHFQGDMKWDDGDNSGGGGGGGKRGGKRPAAASAAASSTAVTGPRTPAPAVVTIVIQSYPDTVALDDGTLLALGDGRVVGCIEEVFGPVSSPMYLLRIKIRHVVDESAVAKYKLASGSAREGPAAITSQAPIDAGMDSSILPTTTTSAISDAHVAVAASDPSEIALEAEEVVPFISRDDISPGVAIFAVKEASKYIFPDKLRAAFPKGSDASNLWDEEVGAGEQEYSDDEAEQVAKEARSGKKRGRAAPAGATSSSASGSGGGGTDATASSSSSRGGRSDPFRAAPSATTGASGSTFHIPPTHSTGSSSGGGGSMYAGVYPPSVSSSSGPPLLPYGSMPPPASGYAGYPPGYQMPPPPGMMPPGGGMSYPAAMQFQMQMQQQWQMQMMMQAQMMAAMARGPPPPGPK